MNTTRGICFHAKINHRLAALENMRFVLPFRSDLRQASALIDKMLVSVSPIIKKGKFRDDFVSFFLCRQNWGHNNHFKNGQSATAGDNTLLRDTLKLS